MFVASISHSPPTPLLVVMIEKKSWRADMFQKAKEVESLEARIKHSALLQSEASQKAECYLSERNELEAEVVDLALQVNRRYVLCLHSL